MINDDLNVIISDKKRNVYFQDEKAHVIAKYYIQICSISFDSNKLTYHKIHIEIT